MSEATLTTATAPVPSLAELIDSAPGRAYELGRCHVFHSWSAQARIKPMVITRAEGSYLWTGDRQRLLDFTSQLVYTNLGHQHPRVVRAIQEQAAQLCTIAPVTVNAARSEAARLIASHTPVGLDKVFFTNGGTPTSTRSRWPGCTPAGPRCSRRTAPTTAEPSWPST